MTISKKKVSKGKAGTEAWKYGPVEESVKMLIERKQPFALVKYKVGMRYLTEMQSTFYELILFQTRNREDPVDCLRMGEGVFNDLIQKYGLTEQYRDPMSGVAYGLDTRLRDLHRQEKKIREAPERAIAEIRRLWVNGNHPESVRKKLREALDEYQAILDASLDAFYKKNNIIIWDFALVRR